MTNKKPSKRLTLGDMKPPKTKKAPPKMTEQEKHIEVLKDIAIAAAEMVYHYKLVARSVGRNEDTLINWRKNDSDFSDKLEEARHRFIQKQIKSARPEFLLERLEPDIFKERKAVEESGTITVVTRKYGEAPEVKDDQPDD